MILKNLFNHLSIHSTYPHFKSFIYSISCPSIQSPADVPFIENREVRIDYNTVDAGMVLDNLEEWEGKNKAKGYDELELPNFDCLVTLTKLLKF